MEILFKIFKLILDIMTTWHKNDIEEKAKKIKQEARKKRNEIRKKSDSELASSNLDKLNRLFKRNRL